MSANRQPPYQRKPKFEKVDYGQCKWIDGAGKRCEDDAIGRFFCAHHFHIATKLESCSIENELTKFNP